ncbi:PHP domain-containing protein [bacterium]|nr:PHP domain-containing protein [bacterium]MBU1752573.1 PHP domain-containing protein [bacterium]
MTNVEIAKVLFKTGEMLEVLGQAYDAFPHYRIAEMIEGLEEDVVGIYRDGKLSDLPGINAKLANKVEELIKTGKLSQYEELLSDMPEWLIDVLDIPCMDAKKAAAIWQSLNIASIEELERAAKRYELQKLPGFDAKAEINLLRGINLTLASKAEKVLLGIALPMARRIAYNLLEMPEVERVEWSGSLRRGKEIVGDIDLLVETNTPTLVIKEFLRRFPPLRVIEQTKNRIIVLNKEGIRVEISGLSSHEFVPLLHFTTGSKTYIANLNKHADDHGLEIKENGLYRKDTNKRFLCDTEEEIYDILGLQYIPPELREGNDEIAMAKENAIPNLINMNDLKGDLHVHSSWSDGASSIEEIAQWAKGKGYKYVGICDHFRTQSSKRKGIKLEDVRHYIEHIKHLNERNYDFKILAGLEVEIQRDGELGITEDELTSFDFVVGAVHSGFEEGIEAVTNRLIRGCNHPLIDIIAHPASRIIGQRDVFVNMERLFKAATVTHTVLEVNSYIARVDLPDIYIRQAKSYGIRFAINTDAHIIDELSMLEYGVFTARRGWLEPRNVINTSEYEELCHTLKRNRGVSRIAL